MGLFKDFLKKAENEVKKAIPKEIRNIVPKEIRHEIEFEVKKAIPKKAKKVFDEADKATCTLEDIFKSADTLFEKHRNTSDSSNEPQRRNKAFRIRSRR